MEIVLSNITNWWLHWQKLWEWDSRFVYDLEQYIWVPLIMKILKNDIERYLQKQCYNENKLYYYFWNE